MMILLMLLVGRHYKRSQQPDLIANIIHRGKVSPAGNNNVSSISSRTAALT